MGIQIPTLDLETPDIGGDENSWGDILDSILVRLAAKVGKVTDIATTGGTATLTDDEEFAAVIDVTGTLTSNATLEFSSRDGVWIIQNRTTGAFTLTVQPAGGTGVEVGQGRAVLVTSDGAVMRSAGAQAASETEAGLVELATVAEAGAGTDSARAVTPAGLYPAKADVASASTAPIGAAASPVVRITGTTTITAFDNVPAGIRRKAYFEGALTLTHNATSLILPGGANIATAAGDRLEAVSLGSGNWLVLWYQRANGLGPITTSAILDLISSTRGSLLYRGASGWAHLAPGSVGQVLRSGGEGADPSWVSVATADAIPVGVIMPYAGTSAPTGWLFCYGQNVSRSVYAELFAAIGTTYGSGDGSTTFGVPDLRGRTVAGKDDMGGTSADRLTNQSGGVNGDVLGAVGGAEGHALTAAQIPQNAVEGVTSASGVPARVTAGHTGSGSAHNNVQPTIILNYIIYAGA